MDNKSLIIFAKREWTLASRIPSKDMVSECTNMSFPCKSQLFFLPWNISDITISWVWTHWQKLGAQSTASKPDEAEGRPDEAEGRQTSNLLARILPVENQDLNLIS